MTDAQAVTRALGGRWHGAYGTACCPAHEDRHALAVAQGRPRRAAAGLLPRGLRVGRRGLRPARAGAAAAEGGDQGHRGSRGGRGSRRPGGSRGTARRGRRLDAAPARRAGAGGGRAPSRAPRPSATCAAAGSRAPCPTPCASTPPAGTAPPRGDAPPSWPSSRVPLPRTASPSFAVHRTYLTREGRKIAPAADAKMMLGATLGGAVRLRGEHAAGTPPSSWPRASRPR